MVKKIILDYLIPAVAIGLIVVAGIFIAQKLGILGGGQAAPPTEVRTVDTPEYKKLDSANKELERRNMYLEIKDSMLTSEILAMDEVINKRQNKTNYETKRIENNTADNNFNELRGLIQSRRQK